MPHGISSNCFVPSSLDLLCTFIAESSPYKPSYGREAIDQRGEPESTKNVMGGDGLPVELLEFAIEEERPHRGAGEEIRPCDRRPGRSYTQKN